MEKKLVVIECGHCFNRQKGYLHKVFVCKKCGNKIVPKHKCAGCNTYVYYRPLCSKCSDRLSKRVDSLTMINVLNSLFDIIGLNTELLNDNRDKEQFGMYIKEYMEQIESIRESIGKKIA